VPGPLLGAPDHVGGGAEQGVPAQARAPHGLMLDQDTLDDLLVSGDDDGGVYDVNLVMRLDRVFVAFEEEADAPSERMRKVGRLVDKYLGEISLDQGLKVSKFLTVAESLPDSVRDCYDGVYRALDIYLEVKKVIETMLIYYDSTI
jgi:hypothetical protein